MYDERQVCFLYAKQNRSGLCWRSTVLGAAQPEIVCDT